MTWDAVRAGLTILYGKPFDDTRVILGNTGILSGHLAWQSVHGCIAMRMMKNKSFAVRCSPANEKAREYLESWRTGGKCEP